MDAATARAQSPSTESIYVAPPGAGIGPGATPPSSVASMPHAMSAQALQTASGTAGPERPSQALVNHTMNVLADKFQMNVDEHTHMEWLMATGLITTGEGETVLEALGIPRHPPVQGGSPTIFHEVGSPATSVSQMLPEVQLNFPPVPNTFGMGAQLPELHPMPTARPPGISNVSQLVPIADVNSPSPIVGRTQFLQIATPSPGQPDHHAGPAWFPQMPTHAR